MAHSPFCQGIAAALRQVISDCGDRTAFRFADQVLTYEQIGAVIADKVAVYHQMGIRESSIVGVMADDPIQFVTDVVALLDLGAFVILLSADTTQWELKRLSATVLFDYILSGASTNANAVVGRDRVLTCERHDRSPVVHGAAVGYLTSGTTGHQKLACRSEKAVLVEAMAVSQELYQAPGRRVAVIVPLSHSFGFGVCAIAGLLAGAELHYFSRMPPSAYLAEFRRSAIEMVPLVPAQLRLIAEACNAPDFGALAAMVAGAPLDPRTARLANERLGCAIGHIYGTSETGTIAIAPPGETLVSGGRACRHVSLRLDPIPPAWGAEETDIAMEGTEGVVSVRSEALFQGYVTSNAIDRDYVKTGWFLTGDCARLVDGRLELVGRLSSAINVGGVKVSPEEVEAVLLEFPAVEMALVVGQDDDLAYRRIKAYVSPEDVDLKALRRFCEQRLSASKRPHSYHGVAKFTTTPSGKIIRTQRIE